jgi:hypothetical protein
MRLMFGDTFAPSFGTVSAVIVEVATVSVVTVAVVAVIVGTVTAAV